MKTIYVNRLKERWKKIPRICPHCDNFLFMEDDSVIRECKKCKLKFEFEMDIPFLFPGRWVIWYVEPTDSKQKGKGK